MVLPVLVKAIWSVAASILDDFILLAAANKLASHFSDLLNVSLPDNKTALFRFYDPRVTHNMPQVLTLEQFNEITMPLIAWYYRFEGQFYALQGGRLNAV